MNLKETRKQARKREQKMILIVIISVLLLVVGGIALLLFGGKDNEISGSNDKNGNTKKENVTETVASFEIETKYCMLYYPETWKEQIEIKYSEEAGYKVEFYGKVEGKETQHLFNICFNSDDGDLLGYFDRDEQVVNVSVERIDLTFGTDWTQEEQDQIYAMQEEMNFVIDMLDKDESYVNP